MTAQVVIRPARQDTKLDAVRQLCWAYRDFLLNASPQDAEITQAFYPVPKYTTLMARLAEVHARPRGIILLAEVDGQAVGCGMTHGLDMRTAEIKRVFVSASARGLGVASKLCRALEEQARSDGYARIVLDTSKSLLAAQRLYTRLGYSARGPYQPIPDEVLPFLLFFEKTLR